MSAATLPQGLPLTLHAGYERRTPRDEDWTAHDGGGLSVRLTTGAEILVGGSQSLDLHQDFADQQGSNRMWLYALEPLRRAGEIVRQGGAEHVESLHAGWAAATEVLGGPGGSERWTRLPSMDHAAATRIRACLEAGQLVDGEQLRRGIREIADQTVEWVLDDANYRANNHGLMSSIALLHWHVAVERAEGRTQALDTAQQRIVALARSSFDEQGMCNENTIGYHNFNLHCYREILQLQEAQQLSETIDSDLRPILERAQRALNLSLLQDGTVPTIGDSGRYRPAIARSVNLPSAFPASGLGLYKSERLYVSLIGGSRSEIHKHADDTGVTIYHDGLPLIVDTGSYLYDRGNPYRRAMESSLGHSVMVPGAFDGVLRRQFVADNPNYRAQLTRHEANEDRCVMEVIADLPGAVTVRRSLTVLDDRWIIVKDLLDFTDTAPDTSARQRWIFGPDLALSRLGTGSWAASQASTTRLSIHHIGAAESELYRGEDFGGHRGWYSEQYGQKAPVTGLDWMGQGMYQVHRTLIDVGDEPVISLAEVPSLVLTELYG